jgi:hypothetical protein
MEEKLQKILELQQQGVDRRQIAEQMGYKRLDSMTKWMKTRGYVVDNDKYILENDADHTEVINDNKHTKVSNDKTNTIVTTKQNDASQPLVINEELKNNLLQIAQEYGEIKDMLEWYRNRNDKDNTNVIEVIRTGLEIQLPKAEDNRTTVRVNAVVWDDFKEFCSRNKHFKEKDLLSMAIKEFTEKYGE